jgi:short-chain fatty acids transporter
VVLGSSPLQSPQWFGEGFWDLVAFTMQVTMLIASGFALANATPVHAMIRRMAGTPTTPKGAAAFVALFSMLSSLASWTFSLIFSGLLAREVAHRVRGVDYRAVGAACLGVGGVWAFGLTSSAALIMAAPASLPPSILRISRVIPLSATIGLWQSLLLAGTLTAVSVAIAYYSAPAAEQARSIQDRGVVHEAHAAKVAEKPERPGEWLEYSPLPTLLIAGLLLH